MVNSKFLSGELEFMRELKVVIVDDHPLFLQGVEEAVGSSERFEVIGTASNGNDALNMILKDMPDIAILDINMPGRNGQQVLAEATSAKVDTKIILITAFTTHDQMLHSAMNGAWGFCSKNILPEDLLQVVHKIADGNYYMNGTLVPMSDFQTWLREELKSIHKTDAALQGPIHPLSTREMDVLREIVKGKTNKEIGLALEIGEQTVKNHFTSIFKKFGVEDRTQAVIYAMKNGWVDIQ